MQSQNAQIVQDDFGTEPGKEAAHLVGRLFAESERIEQTVVDSLDDLACARPGRRCTRKRLMATNVS